MSQFAQSGFQKHVLVAGSNRRKVQHSRQFQQENRWGLRVKTTNTDLKMSNIVPWKRPSEVSVLTGETRRLPELRNNIKVERLWRRTHVSSDRTRIWQTIAAKHDSLFFTPSPTETGGACTSPGKTQVRVTWRSGTVWVQCTGCPWVLRILICSQCLTPEELNGTKQEHCWDTHAHAHTHSEDECWWWFLISEG